MICAEIAATRAVATDKQAHCQATPGSYVHLAVMHATVTGCVYASICVCVCVCMHIYIYIYERMYVLGPSVYGTTSGFGPIKCPEVHARL